MDQVAGRQLQDVALAVVLGVVATFETLMPFSSAMGEGSVPATLVVALLTCAALAARRSHPLLVVLAVFLLWPVTYTVTPVVVLFWGQFVPMVIALFSVARYGTSRQGLLGALAAVATLLFFDLRVQVLRDPGEIVFHWTVCVVAWSLGWFVRAHASRAENEAARAASAEAGSREQALRAVADERARIARELHDIVAHSVSVMVVQAGAAEAAMDDPAFVRQALGSIRSTGTDALIEMRRVVALIRDDGPAELEPQPGVAALERLVQEMEVPTSLRVEGEAQPLSAGVALSLYRIVQEALTNVRRHAHARSVEVSLRYGAGCVRVDVVDDGAGAVDPSGGNGLIGMRERVQMCGGTLTTTTAPGRGFRVSAVLPAGPAR